MRKGSVKEVLAKIKYDPREKEEDYYVVIEHRGLMVGKRKYRSSLSSSDTATSSLEKPRYPTTESCASLERMEKSSGRRRSYSITSNSDVSRPHSFFSKASGLALTMMYPL